VSFPRYPNYGPSGVKWLGDVPTHWEVWKLAHAFTTIGSGTTPKSDVREYYDEGEIPWLNTGDLCDGELEICEKRVTTLALKDHSSLKIYPAGSVVIAMYGATIGKLGMLRFPATVNQARCVFSGPSEIEPEFMFYWFLGLRERVVSLATGGGQPNISQDILRGLRLACPATSEQTRLTEFLDRETAKIDELVAEQRRLMELLKEKRQAVISHAVTRGLNPKAPLKPSGIEWLGDVPKHWQIRRLCLLANFESGMAHEPFVDDDGEYIYVSARFISTGGESRRFCTQNLSPAKENDILMVMSDLPNGRALAKAFFVSDDGPYAVNQRVAIIRATKAHPRFLFHFLDRNPGFLIHDDGMNQTHLWNDLFKKFPTLVPPVSEQEQIAEFIDVQTTMFATLTAEAQRAIDLLQERRTALISAAVTGQIDVRAV
jgi:type I restriction enzyme S subunit